jgi:hypothetical protein
MHRLFEEVLDWWLQLAVPKSVISAVFQAVEGWRRAFASDLACLIMATVLLAKGVWRHCWDKSGCGRVATRRDDRYIIPCQTDGFLSCARAKPTQENFWTYLRKLLDLP